ncbi:hypothetical protein VE04_04663 [Pseudogymnoascus sp. 24MN13]|nr:hypothetical protein VE04_04663 [Pseudogymnoascus sp. 24MN13]
MAPSKLNASIAVPYEKTPAGCPVTPGQLWNPVLGSGPFRVKMVPEGCPLSDGVSSFLVLLPNDGPRMIATSHLAKYKYNFNKKGHIRKHFFSKSPLAMDMDHKIGKCGYALRDATGKIMNIDSIIMRGDSPHDQGLGPGTVNERNFKQQTGFQKWFNELLYGAKTDDVGAAKAFAEKWMRDVCREKGVDDDYDTVTMAYNRRTLKVAEYRVNKGTANSHEADFVESERDAICSDEEESDDKDKIVLVNKRKPKTSALKATASKEKSTPQPLGKVKEKSTPQPLRKGELSPQKSSLTPKKRKIQTVYINEDGGSLADAPPVSKKRKTDSPSFDADAANKTSCQIGAKTEVELAVVQGKIMGIAGVIASSFRAIGTEAQIIQDQKERKRMLLEAGRQLHSGINVMFEMAKVDVSEHEMGFINEENEQIDTSKESDRDDDENGKEEDEDEDEADEDDKEADEDEAEEDDKDENSDEDEANDDDEDENGDEGNDIEKGQEGNGVNKESDDDDDESVISEED